MTATIDTIGKQINFGRITKRATIQATLDFVIKLSVMRFRGSHYRPNHLHPQNRLHRPHLPLLRHLPS